MKSLKSRIKRITAMYKKMSQTFIIIFLSCNLYAQFHEGFVITTENDTIDCEIFSSSYFSGDLNLSSLTNGIITQKDGNKMKYKPNEIKEFSINSLTLGRLSFISIPEDTKKFFQVIVKGRLSFFYLHVKSSDGSGYAVPVLKKNGKLVYLNVVNRNKRVEDLITDYPELLHDWKENKYSFDELDQLVLVYNRYFEMKP